METIKFTKTLKEQNSNPKNVYKIHVVCDPFADIFYLVDDIIIDENDMTKLDVLMLSYLSLTPSIPENWMDEVFCVNEDGDKELSAFAGYLCPHNDRFPLISDYVLRRKLLLKDKDGHYCKTILGVSVTYYDADGVEYQCECPKIAEEFATEKEFIDYVMSITNKKEQQDYLDEMDAALKAVCDYTSEHNEVISEYLNLTSKADKLAEEISRKPWLIDEYYRYDVVSTYYLHIVNTDKDGVIADVIEFSKDDTVAHQNGARLTYGELLTMNKITKSEFDEAVKRADQIVKR